MKLMVDRSIFDPDGPTLSGSKCARCNAIHFPPRQTCPDCFFGEVERVALSRDGTLAAFTQIYLKDPGLPTPCIVGDVHLADGVRLYAPLEGISDLSELRTGSAVRLVAGVVRSDPGAEEIIGYRFRLDR